MNLPVPEGNVVGAFACASAPKAQANTVKKASKAKKAKAEVKKS